MKTQTITITQARKNLYNIAEEAKKSNTCFHLTTSGKDGVILMSKKEFESWQETMKIMRDPALYQELLDTKDDFKKENYDTWENTLKMIEKQNAK